MSINTIFSRFVLPEGEETTRKPPKKPQMHPIIQLYASKWKLATAQKCYPDWSIFTPEYIAALCAEQQRNHPGWNNALYAVDLSHYLAGQNPDKMWWRSQAPPEHEDGVSYYSLGHIMVMMIVVHMGGMPPPALHAALAPPAVLAPPTAPALPTVPALPTAPTLCPLCPLRRNHPSNQRERLVWSLQVHLL
jgi:hypothetical protein